jgi:hypothetical protein
MSTWVPVFVVPPGSSMQRPEAVLTSALVSARPMETEPRVRTVVAGVPVTAE